MFEDKSHGLGFRVAYDGRRYSGFQIQSGRNSIQAELERALKIFFRREIRIQYTSRTDTGVSAVDQWINIPEGWQYFQTLSPSDRDRCAHSLNGLLPADIRIWKMMKLSPQYHPKTSVRWKEYRYLIAHGPTYHPAWISPSWWIRSPLDRRKIHGDLQTIVGTHDFAGFMSRASRYEHSTSREIFRAELHERPSSEIADLTWIEFRIRGSGFLHHMVRNIVGSIVAHARGQLQDFTKILLSKKRRDAGVRAPAEPLRLYRTAVSRRFYEEVT